VTPGEEITKIRNAVLAVWVEEDDGQLHPVAFQATPIPVP
jgi:hypothetical protein